MRRVRDPRADAGTSHNRNWYIASSAGPVRLALLAASVMPACLPYGAESGQCVGKKIDSNQGGRAPLSLSGLPTVTAMRRWLGGCDVDGQAETATSEMAGRYGMMIPLTGDAANLSGSPLLEQWSVPQQMAAIAAMTATL